MTFALKLTTDCQRIGINYEPDQSYETISQAVGGWIECVSLTPTLDMWVNEEGKLNGLPYNPDATAIFWSHFGMSDVIVGDVLFTSHNEDGETTSLENEQMKYLEQFLGKLGAEI